MIRHSSITTTEDNHGAHNNSKTFSLGSSDPSKRNLFERKIVAYLSEDNGGYEGSPLPPPPPSAEIKKTTTGATSSETDQDGK